MIAAKAMDMNTSWYTYILIYSSTQLILFSTILFFIKKNNIKANRILALLLFCIGFGLMLDALDETFFILENLPVLVSFSMVIGTIIPFILYLYTKAYLSNSYLLSKRYLFHLVPFAIQFFLWMTNVTSLSYEEKRQYIDQRHVALEWYPAQFLVQLVILLAFYSFLIGKDINKYHKQAKEEYSYSNRNILNWFYGLIAIIVAAPFVSITQTLANNKKDVDILFVIFNTMLLLVVIIIIIRPEIYRGIALMAPVELKEKRKSSSSLPESKKKQIFDELTDYIDKEDAYLNSKITIRKLSEALNTNTTYLSQAINDIANQSFFDFVNSYRIEHAKKMLVSDQFSKYTIEAIGTESGFVSKSAFYNSFKKFNGLSPLQYKNKILD